METEPRTAHRGSPAEAWLAAIVEDSDDAIVSKNLDGIVTSWNKAAERLFGYPAEEMVGQPIARLMPPGRDSEEEEILGRIRRGGRFAHYETQRRRKDGRLIDVALTISPVRDPSGRIVGASKIARDVTERKAMQARLRELSTLREEDEFKTRLFNTAAHELNTPLTPMLMQVEMLRTPEMGPLNERQARALRLLDRNLRRLEGLIQEMLDVARLQNGRAVIQRRPFDLARLAEELVESYRPAMAARGLALELRNGTGVPALGDEQRLAQVLGNLLSNALKFTPPDGRVVVAVEPRDDHAILEVHDTGIGIEPDQLPRLFQPFVQLHDPRRFPQDRGNGLGLYISRLIAEAHGGRIEATSPGPGEGATFTVVLPSPPAPPGEPGPHPAAAAEDAKA